MAIPPEPIDEVLPLAHAGVIAEVVKILHRGVQTFIPEPDPPGTVDIPRDLPEEIALLRIKERLFGDLALVGQEIEVDKPAGDYVLRAGVVGPFLLSKEGNLPRPVIVGRYGPDTYSLRSLQAAILRHKRR